MDSGKTLHYRRSRFSTHLPLDYLYSPSHSWLARQSSGRWRVGLTKFATRMLGEMVDHGFEIQPEAPVVPGQILGWVEGFKAISDVYCIVRGQFHGSNPTLKTAVTAIGREPYGAGWLYEADGEPDAQCMDANRYAALLDKAIDRILEKQQQEEIK